MFQKIINKQQNKFWNKYINQKMMKYSNYNSKIKNKI